MRRSRRRWVQRRRQQGRSWIRVATTRQGRWAGPQPRAEYTKLATSGAALEQGDRAHAQPQAWRRQGEWASPAQHVAGYSRVPMASHLPLGESALETEELPERAAPECQGGRAVRGSCKDCDARKASPEGSARGWATDRGGAQQSKRRMRVRAHWEQNVEGILEACPDGDAGRGWEGPRRPAP